MHLRVNICILNKTCKSSINDFLFIEYTFRILGKLFLFLLAIFMQKHCRKYFFFIFCVSKFRLKQYLFNKISVFYYRYLGQRAQQYRRTACIINRIFSNYFLFFAVFFTQSCVLTIGFIYNLSNTNHITLIIAYWHR